MSDLTPAIEAILRRRSHSDPASALLVAISGIDGSGKGYVTDRLQNGLARSPFRTVSINVDGWLQLPPKRFDPARPAEHFYEAGIRFDDMFEQLIVPLKTNRSVSLLAPLADATNASEYQMYRYELVAVDIILLEGIFLLKRQFRAHYDLGIWIECSFETALARALQRGQEGLSEAETIRDYERIYFAAQRVHFANDAPQIAADLVIDNDRGR